MFTIAGISALIYLEPDIKASMSPGSFKCQIENNL